MPNYVIHDGEKVVNACVADDIDAVKNTTDLQVMESDGNPWIGWTLEEEGWREPSPHPSWTWDSVKKEWVAPVPYPEDGMVYLWDEESLSWQPPSYFYDFIQVEEDGSETIQ